MTKHVAIALLCRKLDENKMLCYKDLMERFDFYVIEDQPNPSIERQRHFEDQAYTLVNIPEEFCASVGYVNSSTATLFKQCIAWDKGLYYFARYRTEHESVWFMEDDVYVPLSAASFIGQIPSSIDLVCSKVSCNSNGLREWLWNDVKNRLELPWFRAMICIIRMSRRLLDVMDRFVCEKHTLLFIEYFIPTLAMQNSLEVFAPREFDTIVYSHYWNAEDVRSNPSNFFHPIKSSRQFIENHLIQEGKITRYTTFPFRAYCRTHLIEIGSVIFNRWMTLQGNIQLRFATGRSS